MKAEERVSSPDDMSFIIREAVKSHTSTESKICSINCEASWEVLQYCQMELFGDSDLRKAVTLTGTLARAQADSCEEFIRTIWGSSGIQLLEAFVSGLSERICGK
jgi:hypothetical protein